MRSPRSTFALVLALLAASFFASNEAKAQFGAAGFADAFRPEFLDRDMPLFVEQLQLEDWQRPIVEVLLQDYATAFEIGVEQVKERMKAEAINIGGTTRNEDAMKSILEPITAWDAERRVLRDTFLINVKAQLSSDQINRWPRFERSLRREKELPKGELSGESIDLYTMIRTMRMPYEIEEAIDPLLVQYELELDTVLAARKERIDSLQDVMKDAMTAMDFDQGLDASDKIMERRVAVRRVQDAWVDRLASELPAEYGTALRRDALERAYPKAFRPTAIPRLLESVRSIPDLSNDQLAAFDRIEAQFDADLTGLQARIVETIRETEPGDARRKIERLLARRNGQQVDREPSEVDKLLAKKNDLVDKTRREILAVLTPEQTDLLPGQRTPRLNDPSRVGAPGLPGAQGGGGKPAGPGSRRLTKDPPAITPRTPGNGRDEIRGKTLDRTGNSGGSTKGGRGGSRGSQAADD